ncbi:cytochrome c3 family protein [Geothermobacter hydrogeniphilus]|uniref:Doubled CXXCH motif domain-containing protein n=1 Tax=Geothermobacter hydrogeniphilus TaxID=1969733 RepID=A0A1X0XX18_9BACT|nr:cytochrome c3 family protein [Geothermobacter hydrogeniphilus]ORJ57434.1 hypothetical protein B5V00_13965 [Geothermobacter hydrogeniphilus]
MTTGKPVFHGSGPVFTILIAILLLGLSNPAGALNIAGSKHDLTGVIPGLTDICRACHGGAHNWLPGANGFGRIPRYVTQVYSSNTLDHTIDLSYINTMPSDAPLCLSCHDGSLADQTEYSYLKPLQGTKADLGTDLSNDHPVGFRFDATLDKGIKDPVIARVHFGSTGDAMWCSSCHEVHDPANVPFLVMSNANSALCKDCHIK